MSRLTTRLRPLLLMPKIAVTMAFAPVAGGAGGESTSPPASLTLSRPGSEEEAAEQVAEAEEAQDPRGHHSGDQGHHREQFGSGAFRAHSRSILAQFERDS